MTLRTESTVRFLGVSVMFLFEMIRCGFMCEYVLVYTYVNTIQMLSVYSLISVYACVYIKFM